jgi:hypothetical protein
LSPFHATKDICNPGSWSHKAAEEFTTPAREASKEECYSTPFDASLLGMEGHAFFLLPLPTFRVLAFETQKGRAAANPGTTLCAPNYL